MPSKHTPNKHSKKKTSPEDHQKKVKKEKSTTQETPEVSETIPEMEKNLEVQSPPKKTSPPKEKKKSSKEKKAKKPSPPVESSSSEGEEEEVQPPPKKSSSKEKKAKKPSKEKKKPSPPVESSSSSSEEEEVQPPPKKSSPSKEKEEDGSESDSCSSSAEETQVSKTSSSKEKEETRVSDGGSSSSEEEQEVPDSIEKRNKELLGRLEATKAKIPELEKFLCWEAEEDEESKEGKKGKNFDSIVKENSRTVREILDVISEFDDLQYVPLADRKTLIRVIYVFGNEELFMTAYEYFGWDFFNPNPEGKDETYGPIEVMTSCIYALSDYGQEESNGRKILDAILKMRKPYDEKSTVEDRRCILRHLLDHVKTLGTFIHYFHYLQGNKLDGASFRCRGTKDSIYEVVKGKWGDSPNYPLFVKKFVR